MEEERGPWTFCEGRGGMLVGAMETRAGPHPATEG